MRVTYTYFESASSIKCAPLRQTDKEQGKRAKVRGKKCAQKAVIPDGPPVPVFWGTLKFPGQCCDDAHLRGACCTGVVGGSCVIGSGRYAQESHLVEGADLRDEEDIKK
eukprot:1157219-Pelagomonas_calceolata.AAC.9